MKSQRIIMLAVLSVVVIALLAACSGGTVGGTKAPASGINVSATEFEFRPNKFEGKVGQQMTFRVTNKGTVEHNFVILSPDGSQELAKITTQPGETKTLDFTPTAAVTYPIDCNIAGHKEAGMVGELVVN